MVVRYTIHTYTKSSFSLLSSATSLDIFSLPYLELFSELNYFQVRHITLSPVYLKVNFLNKVRVEPLIGL